MFGKLPVVSIIYVKSLITGGKKWHDHIAGDGAIFEHNP
jgi:hypothetical protein